jgi:NitT/TauT family transport system permease protein
MNELTWRSTVAVPIATSVALLVTWELVSIAGLVPPYVLPAPSVILSRLGTVWPSLAGHSVVTVVEIVLGFLLAVVVGGALALVIVYYPPFEATVAPWIVVSQVIPKVALGPLFVIWLGFGLLPKVIIAFLIAFFPILIDTVVGLRSVDRDSIFLLQAMGAGRWKIFRYLLLPNALPNIFAGMKVAITLATVGAIVGEFVGANEGLGYVILFANGTMDTSLLFSALVVLSVVAFLLYAVIGLLQSIFVRWHVSQRVGSSAVTM